ncbi:SOSS complex subunit B1 [Lepeophtheirus salmonis]|uniref:SOSS complex subunit B1 n=1 Tax=Lepeophtheirus salmonis TaxID=72036 RepID=UPI00077F1423|nr:SOSS complex subunit B1-like [Lepeophtheirus salmonis]
MAEFMSVRNLKPGLKDLQLMCIILDIGRPNVTKDGHEVRTVKVADKTGAVNLSVWDDPGKLINSGDIIRISKVYTNVWKNCLTLYIGKGGELSKVGEFCLVFSETPFMSDPNPELAAVQAQIQAERSSGGGNASGPGKMYSTNNGSPSGKMGGGNMNSGSPNQSGGFDFRNRSNGSFGNSSHPKNNANNPNRNNRTK